MSNANQAGSKSGENNGTTENHFGNAVESQAQIADADKIATGTVPGESLNIYRLEPLTSLSDLRRDIATSSGSVTVAARTAGDARVVAAGAELDFQEIDAAPAGDVSTRHASVFRDEKSYTVIEVERGRTDLQRGVIDGDICVDVIKPVPLQSD